MNILSIINQAKAAAIDYLALPADQRTDVATAARNGYAARIADWRGFGLTDAKFHQFELAFGLAVTQGINQ